MSAVPPSPQRILVVDDTPTIHADFRKILLPGGHDPLAHEAELFSKPAPVPVIRAFEVDSAYQGREALAMIQRGVTEGRPYAVAFVDMRMPPGWDGIETIQQLWTVDPHLQVVICTAHSDYTWEETVGKLGLGDNWVILKKPFDNVELLQLAHALGQKWLVTQRDRHRLADLDEMVRQRTAELHRSEDRFTKAFHANPVPVAIQALSDGRYLDVNEAFLRLTGHSRSEVLQHTPEQLSLWPGGSVWQASVESLSAQHPLRDYRAELRTKASDVRTVVLQVASVSLDGEPCLLTNLEDITVRLQLEEQLRQAHRMEAVGQLAAGVAHDFNNMLTVIQTYSSLALDDPAIPSEHRAGLAEVVAAAQRAGALTRQLLIFSRRQITQPKPLDLNTTLSGLRKMLGRVLPAQIQLDWSDYTPVPRVRADEANIEQVVMNLVVNARDALARGGRIWVGLRAATLGLADAARHAQARPGRFVCLTVRDNGTGIDPTVLPRIFEPFFTTKGVGEGTGLGLSTVYAIVQQHSGWIEVASAPGHGTTFELFLPAFEEPANIALPPPPSTPSSAPPRGRGERILLVEDEPAVRLTTKLIALRSGYKVVEATDARNALEVWAQQTEPFDLLLTDIVMPHGTNGAELAAELRARQPSLKIVLSTGYSGDLLTKEARGLEGVRLLQKPYTSEVLLATLHAALTETSRTTNPT